MPEVDKWRKRGKKGPNTTHVYSCILQWWVHVFLLRSYFNRTFDAETGFVTKNMLVIPINMPQPDKNSSSGEQKEKEMKEAYDKAQDAGGGMEVIALLQIMNKASLGEVDARFNKEDDLAWLGVRCDDLEDPKNFQIERNNFVDLIGQALASKMGFTG